MFRKTAWSTASVVAAQHCKSPQSLRLHFASRAVKIIGGPQSSTFRCPTNGSAMSVSGANSSALVHLTSSSAQKSAAVIDLVGPDSTVVGVRDGKCFLKYRTDGDAKVASAQVDVVEGDVIAIVHRMNHVETDAAVESLLDALSRAATVEEAAESMLVEAHARPGAFAMLSTLHHSPSSCVQPPESNV